MPGADAAIGDCVNASAAGALASAAATAPLKKTPVGRRIRGSNVDADLVWLPVS